MVKRFLIDTNVLTDAQAKRLPEAGLKFLKGIIDKEFNISFISYIEFLGYENATQEMEQFPDAIIAASAITHNLILVTHNISDFKAISGLQLVNPYHHLKQIS